MLDDKPDEELMVAYQLGDELAFNELYKRHSARVYGFLKAKAPEEGLARDIFQATFLKLHKSRSKYNPAFPFVPWLFTICRNELVDAMRKRSRTLEVPTAILPGVPEAVDESSPSVQIDLCGLPGKQREALEMRVYSEFSFEEIAARLETSPMNARQLVSRAVKFLRNTYGSK